MAYTQTSLPALMKDSFGIWGNYQGSEWPVSINTPDEKMVKLGLKGENINQDFLTSNILLFFVELHTEPGVFLLLNLDQFIVLAEECYITADIWKTIQGIMW